MKNKQLKFKSILLILTISILYLFSLILLLKDLNFVDLYEISILFSVCIFALILFIYSIFIKNNLISISSSLIFLISITQIIIIRFSLIPGGIESIIWLNIVFQGFKFLVYLSLAIGLSIHYKNIRKNHVIRKLAFDNNEATLFTYNFEDESLHVDFSKELMKLNHSKKNNGFITKQFFLDYIFEEDHEIFLNYIKVPSTKETVIVVRFKNTAYKDCGYLTFKDGIRTGKNFTFLGIDTSLLQKSLSKIEELDKTKAVMLENLDVGILEIELNNPEETDFIIIYANKNLKKELNLNDKPILNKSIKEVFDRNYKELSSFFLKTINDGIPREEELFYFPNNSWYKLLTYKNGEKKLVVMFENISFFKEQEKEQEYKIYHDPFTDLYNNRGVHKYLTTLGNQNKIICFYIDLADFSWVNNYYPMVVSDDILQQIAAELRETFPKEVFIGRYFTDHFVVILKDPTDEVIQTSLKSLKESNGKIYFSGRHSVRIQRNIGYAIYPEDTKEVKEIVFLANLAMKKSSNATGPEPFHYFPGLKEIKEENMKNIELLKEAILNKSITVYFQKVIDVRNNNVLMVESLARWQKDDGSFVSPLTFIKLAIDGRIIKMLEDLLISESLRKYSELIKISGYEATKLSLNLSPPMFLNKETISLINNYLKIYDLSSNKIYIEISEETFVHNLKECNEIIDLYKKNGFKISIDDFGSSYSSLTILDNIEYDVLKIDGNFVAHYQLEKNKKIIKMIIDIANIDNKKVVAEGVETKEMVEYLTSVSCFVHQGYYFHKPENIIK